MIISNNNLSIFISISSLLKNKFPFLIFKCILLFNCKVPFEDTLFIDFSSLKINFKLEESVCFEIIIILFGNFSISSFLETLTYFCPSK